MLRIYNYFIGMNKSNLHMDKMQLKARELLKRNLRETDIRSEVLL